MNERNTPMAYRGMSAVTLARKAMIKSEARVAKVTMPREYTMRLPR